MVSVPTIPLFVHERHSTQGILNGLDSYCQAGTMLDLFGDPQLDIAEKLEAYEHKGPWVNRLVLGDSLQVMNSLLEYEGTGGQVQIESMAATPVELFFPKQLYRGEGSCQPKILSFMCIVA